VKTGDERHRSKDRHHDKSKENDENKEVERDQKQVQWAVRKFFEPNMFQHKVDIYFST